MPDNGQDIATNITLAMNGSILSGMIGMTANIRRVTENSIRANHRAGAQTTMITIMVTGTEKETMAMAIIDRGQYVFLVSCT
jgi:hypothetical protein